MHQLKIVHFVFLNLQNKFDFPIFIHTTNDTIVLYIVIV